MKPASVRPWAEADERAVGVNAVSTASAVCLRLPGLVLGRRRRQLLVPPSSAAGNRIEPECGGCMAAAVAVLSLAGALRWCDSGR